MVKRTGEVDVMYCEKCDHATPWQFGRVHENTWVCQRCGNRRVEPYNLRGYLLTFMLGAAFGVYVIPIIRAWLGTN